MKKIVINTCFGGFGLSEEAMFAYAKRKGITLYPEQRTFGASYFTVPKEERVTNTAKPWDDMTLEERRAFNKAYAKQRLYDKEIPRDDPDLIAVVEELGERANAPVASLKVIEIPEDATWEIDEYDGREHIAEVHRTWG